MDKVLTDEGGNCFDFSASLDAFKADSDTYHGLSALDFVVETDENILFIEVKHPDSKKATKRAREVFLKDLQNKYYPYKAGEKYKSMLLRKWVSGEFYSKPIICVFILEFSDFSKTERAILKEKMFNRIPFSLNKPEFGGKKHFEKRFELLSFSEFRSMFPSYTLTENV